MKKEVVKPKRLVWNEDNIINVSVDNRFDLIIFTKSHKLVYLYIPLYREKKLKYNSFTKANIDTEKIEISLDIINE